MKKKLTDTILVTGGGGMVASYFQGKKNAIVLGKDVLDITNPSSIQKAIDFHKPQVIVNLAALTNVDFCEQQPKEAYKVNALGSFLLAEACKKSDIFLVQVSTGGVFAGTRKKPYTINDKPRPISVYTQSKWFAEEMVLNILPHSSAVVRTGWIFGGGERDKKFVGLVAKQVLDGATEVKAVTKTTGCPTYAKDLAETILSHVVSQRLNGIHHIVNKGKASRYEMAQVIAQVAKRNITVTPIYPNALPAFFAPRPEYEVIQPTVSLRHWKTALKEYLNIWKLSQK